MSEDTAKLLKEQFIGKNPQDKVFNIKKNSVNKYLRRRCEKLNIRTADGSKIKSGVHGIRKLYCENREKDGHSRNTIIRDIGHSEKGRHELEKVYFESLK